MVSGAGIAPDPKCAVRRRYHLCQAATRAGAGVDLSTMNPKTGSSSRPSVGVVGAGRLGTSLARALRAAGLTVDGPLGRGEVPPGDASLLCVPDAEIPAAAEAVTAAAPMVGHTSGATPLTALEPAGVDAFGLHPLQTFAGDEGPEAFAGAGCAIAGSSPAALAVAAGARRARWACAPFEIDDRGRAAYHAAASVASNFLVTLKAAAERIAAGAGLEPDPGPRAAGAAGAPARWRTGPRWGPSAPSPARWPAATRTPWPPSAPRSRSPRPSCSPLFDVMVERTRAAGGKVPGMSTVRTVAELRDGAAPSARRPHDRPRAHDGLLPRGPPVADARAPARSTTWSWCRCSSTRPSSAPSEDLDAYPRDEAARRRAGRRRGRRRAVRPAAGGGLPRRLRHRGARERPHRDAGGRPRAARPSTSTASTTVVLKLLNMARPRRRLLRPEGRPAGAGDPPHGPRPGRAGPDRGAAHRARARRAGAELAQRLPVRPPSAERALALSGALRAPRTPRWPRGELRRLGRARRRPQPSWRPPASSPSTWSCARPTTLPPSSGQRLDPPGGRRPRRRAPA